MKTTQDTLGTATYSPEDNKLRFNPFARLVREDYDRIKAAGFIWAPKQELFVAPMWTPEREDLLLEWCGEIDDEDTSLVDRAEARAERFEDYSEKRADDAEMARKGVAAIAEHIPFGQPILVGHHSEKHARRDAERIENGMRRAVKMWETSKYWQQRAAGAISHAKYLERPDVRARRIKKIEAEKRKQERNKVGAERGLKFWRGGFFLKNRETGEARPLEITEANRECICRALGNDPDLGYLPVIRKQADGPAWECWQAWDVLRPDGERYRECPACTVEQCREAAERVYSGSIARYDRWIAHYENRLAYERAMLAADGGTVADRTGPEVGGACKCWANRGWSKIQKVNKVTVTVLDNWGNTNADGSPCRDFPRNIPFDKLAGVMTKAQVDLARLEKRIYAETSRSFELAEPEAPKAEDNVCPDGPACPDPECIKERKKIGIESEQFEAMKDSLKAGVQVVSAPQLFPTPDALVKQMVELADIWCVQRILEPSAGTGAILEWVTGKTAKEPVAVEVNSKLAESLKQRWPGVDVRCADFLECNGDLGKFDRILMNPPFERGSDIRHIKHAMTFLNPGGRLVAICANGPKQREELEPLCDQWIDLPPGSFESQGTGVNTAMIVINR